MLSLSLSRFLSLSLAPSHSRSFSLSLPRSFYLSRSLSPSLALVLARSLSLSLSLSQTTFEAATAARDPRSTTRHHAFTCIMFVSCWKSIGSPPLNQSPNTLEAFDGIYSLPYGFLRSFPITLDRKTIELKVEVVDMNLNYNLLLGRSWTHAMFCVVSSLFRMLSFPREVKIVIVNQLSFSLPTLQMVMSHMWGIPIFHMRVWGWVF